MNADNKKLPETSLSLLEDIFATFNKVSVDLGNNYQQLEARVCELNTGLATTSWARVDELTERAQLAAKLSALMDALPGGVIVLDPNGRIVEENPAAIHILGQSFRGKSWIEALSRAASVASSDEGEIMFKNGRRVSIDSSTYGEDDETIILLTDVTENYRLSNLVNREKRLSALGEMSARLAHQVRTPLSSAILYLSHLTYPARDTDSSRLVIKKILERLRQIESLVDGMLSYIRGDISTHQEFCLNGLLREVSEAIQLQINDRAGNLEVFLLDGSCVIRGDHDALFNALINLVENALQATPGTPEICITLNRDSNGYLIDVEDNGPGIDAAIKEKIFDPFFSTRESGTGLGLAVVLSAIRAHDGKVATGTSRLGGALFQIAIPVHISALRNRSGIWRAEPHTVPEQVTPRLATATN